MKDKLSRYILSVMSEDSVGIVARLTSAVYKLNGNIDALYQGVIHGYFVITFLATFKGIVTVKEIRLALESGEKDSSLTVSIMPRKEHLSPAVKGSPFVLTISGSDSPGILSKITSLLAQHRINIEDFNTETSEEMFDVIALLTIPETTDVRSVRNSIREALGAVEVTLMHEDIFNATSQIEMRPTRRYKK